jgi:concanavalin A-like lectin/glucanase superfamily protein
VTLCGWSATLCSLLACPQLQDDDFVRAAQPRVSVEAGVEPGAGGSGGALQDQAGKAGNGSAGGTVTLLASLKGALAHRYSFDGSGTEIADSIAEAHGRLVNANLDGRGFAELLGDDAFVNLPNGMLSSSNDKTLEAWLIWKGGGRWQRVFDFGSSDRGEAQRGQGTSYLYLTTRGTADAMSVAYSTDGLSGETRLVSSVALPIGSMVHVAVVIDSQADKFALYVNGALDASRTLVQRLSEISDVNSWLGLAQYETDPGLNADLLEFRLYDQALSDAEVGLSFELGPDPAFLTRAVP